MNSLFSRLHMKKGCDNLCPRSCAMKMHFSFLTRPVTFKRGLYALAFTAWVKGDHKDGGTSFFIKEPALWVLSPAWSWEPKQASCPLQSWYYLDFPHSGSRALISKSLSPGFMEKGTAVALLSQEAASSLGPLHVGQRGLQSFIHSFTHSFI